jgi:hypothetical protein
MCILHSNTFIKLASHQFFQLTLVVLLVQFFSYYLVKLEDMDVDITKTIDEVINHTAVTIINADFKSVVVVSQCLRRSSRKKSAVSHRLEVTINGAIMIFECLLQNPSASIKMQFELMAQRVFIERRRAAIVRLIFKACLIVVEALKPISNGTIGQSAFAE